MMMTAFSHAKTNTLIVLDEHPVVSHALACIRNKTTAAPEFRNAMRQVGHVLMAEATRRLPTVPTPVETPLQTTVVQVRDASIPILIVPILRAGLVWADLALEWLPEAHLYHLGMARNEDTLEPITYYNKLETSNFNYATARVLVLDPMLATGGSSVASIEVLKQLGVTEPHITFACLIASPEGIETMTRHCPAVQIVAAALDECLNEKGYIVPGLGDAGDRTFGTL
jgi:uracil phosphoribosyltransferase